MSRFLVGLLFFTSVARAELPALGTWKLVSVNCASGELGKLGLDNQRDISSGTVETFQVVSQTDVQQQIYERKGGPEDFCKTVFSAKWTAQGSSVHVSGNKFVSRESHGKFKCYEPYHQRTEKQRDFDVKVRLDGDKFSVISPDITIIDAKKMPQHFCVAGSDFVSTYQKQAQ